MTNCSGSMQELITSPTRSLLVGADQVHTTVHANLFRGISVPLHQLLNNQSFGHTSDINDFLRHDDTEAFLQLIRLAYKVAAGEGHGSFTNLSAVRNSASIGQQAAQQSTLKPAKAARCTVCKKGQLEVEVGCSDCDYEYNYGFAVFIEAYFQQQQHDALSTGTTCSSSRSPLEAPLDLKDSASKHHPLLHFAKVWALAAKYSVHGLQASALRAFNRRLKRYAKQNEQDRELDELLDVLRYLASNHSTTPPCTAHELERNASPITAAAEEDTSKNDTPTIDQIEGGCHLHDHTASSIPTSPTLLRSLMRYVATQLDTLIKEEEFRELMAEHGTIGLELAMVFGEIMAASEIVA